MDVSLIWLMTDAQHHCDFVRLILMYHHRAEYISAFWIHRDKYTWTALAWYCTLHIHPIKYTCTALPRYKHSADTGVQTVYLNRVRCKYKTVDFRRALLRQTRGALLLPDSVIFWFLSFSEWLAISIDFVLGLILWAECVYDKKHCVTKIL